ncbi:hypothetical protein Egran_06808 [Elaphomyces granulatus]|uniref:Uncharacterized protein n=1 Tax=Elaphomyces granulatus TaxID=519963 RepID=A0A232LMV1_9EURO|nr:hypothetical protein Egran_06808 [Elaphomyces granulatus]
MERLRSLWVMKGCQEMELPLKSEMDDHFVFCKVEEAGGRIRILREQHLSNSTLCPTLSGPLQDLTSIGWVSDAQRNLILMHSDSSTFLRHYRPRYHGSMQEVILRLPPNEEWEWAPISRSRDTRRPRHLSQMEKALVEDDPELQAAIQEQNDLEAECNPDPALLQRLKKNVPR